MQRLPQCVVVLVLLFGLLLLPLSHVSAHDTQVQGVRQNAEEPVDALVGDAQEYAKIYGVDQTEALRRLRLQAPIGQLSAKLESAERATFAGLIIQHRPAYRVIALFTRDGATTIQRYTNGTSLADIVEAGQARFTLAQLEATQGGVTRTLRSLGVASDSRINIQDNRVEILVTDPVQLTAALLAGGVQLPEGAMVVTVPGLARPAVSAGDTGNGCTIGFSVRGPEGTGTTTAAHCPDNQTWNGNGGLIFTYSWYYGPYDVQWHQALVTVYSRAYDGFTAPFGERAISSTQGRSDQTIGEFVCIYGITTHYGCGTIVSKNYIGAANGANTGPMDTTFIQVHQDNTDLALEGDSGGPWFSGNTALGITNGTLPTATGRDGIYMAVDYIQAVGLTVLVDCYSGC